AAIVAGVAAGELTPSQAAQLAEVVDVYVRAIETKAFDERLSKVEAAVKSAPDRTWDGAGHGDAGVCGERSCLEPTVSTKWSKNASANPESSSCGWTRAIRLRISKPSASA